MRIIRSVLLPLVEKNVLLPDTVLAEVSMLFINSNNRQGNLLVGSAKWHGFDLPIISVEQNNILDAVKHKNNTFPVAVFKIKNNPNAVKYVGAVLYGLPKVIKVSDNDLKLTKENNNTYFRYAATMQGQTVYMLDLERFFDAINNLIK